MLTSFGGGLSPLPSWVRHLVRVWLWVSAKLVINGLRIMGLRKGLATWMKSPGQDRQLGVAHTETSTLRTPMISGGFGMLFLLPLRSCRHMAITSLMFSITSSYVLPCV